MEGGLKERGRGQQKDAQKEKWEVEDELKGMTLVRDAEGK